MARHWHPASCRSCGKHKSEARHISATGLCRDCSLERETANLDQLRAKRGPFAAWWAARMAVSVGLYPLDELPPRP